jgi:hypothetical protein
MEHFAGLDVSVKETSICIADDTGRIVREVKVASEPEALLKVLRNPAYRFTQVDALGKLRRGGEQRVVVEHVHIHAGGQAIVGAVTHTGGPRGLIENQGQPHATTASPIVASDGEEMRSQNPERETVPVSSGEGPQALPNARRGTRIRSTKR